MHSLPLLDAYVAHLLASWLQTFIYLYKLKAVMRSFKYVGALRRWEVSLMLAHILRPMHKGGDDYLEAKGDGFITPLAPTYYVLMIY